MIPNHPRRGYPLLARRIPGQYMSILYIPNLIKKVNNQDVGMQGEKVNHLSLGGVAYSVLCFIYTPPPPPPVWTDTA
jgi:hypothetical protein